MKSRSLIIILMFLHTLLFAQKGNYLIKGIVIDSSTHKPLDYVTVNLKSSNRLVKTMLSATNGSFIFEDISFAKYSISIISVGYNIKNIDVVRIDTSNNIIDLGEIHISTSSTILNEVVVSAEVPIFKQEVDRISYNVQADPESKSANLLDMLRKVPLVTIDGDDNIQIKGSGNFKVLINGRTSSIVAREPKDVFRSMPASHIERIEIITTPPAKYDSEGLAGIINIITYKK